ncbi:MAG: hypothetical protein ACOX2K_03445 [Bacillota bacterium]|jgi:hypothetical protein
MVKWKVPQVGIARLLWLVLTLMFLTAAIMAARESAQLIAGLRSEMLVSLEDVANACNGGDMIAAERAALRFWRLATLEADTLLAAAEGRELCNLASALANAAAGWKAVPLQPSERLQVITQLLNIKQMIQTGDYSHADSVMVWLER